MTNSDQRNLEHIIATFNKKNYNLYQEFYLWGEKDLAQKTLEAYNDVFADIVNVLLFDGNRLVHEDQLAPESPDSSYKVDGKLHELKRDVSKYWKHNNIRLALVGLENQIEIDKYMPIRVMSYDATAYRQQLLNQYETDEKNRQTVQKKESRPDISCCNSGAIFRQYPLETI